MATARHAKLTKAQSRLIEITKATTLQRALSRTVALGEGDCCTRCGGGGHYSYCQMYGTRCFKCGGRGVQAPRVTAALCDRVQARVDAGELDEYFARNRRIAEAKKAGDKLHAAWGELPEVKLYAKQHFTKQSFLKGAINTVCAALSDICHKASLSIAYTKDQTDADREKLAALCEACIAAVPSVQDRIEAEGYCDRRQVDFNDKSSLDAEHAVGNKVLRDILLTLPEGFDWPKDVAR